MIRESESNLKFTYFTCELCKDLLILSFSNVILETQLKKSNSNSTLIGTQIFWFLFKLF